MDTLVIRQVQTKYIEKYMNYAALITASCLCEYIVSLTLGARLISVIICAAYTLASSLVAYVTFTTAVSVSVFTVRQDKERRRKEGGRERKKKCEIVNKGLHMHRAGLGLLP